MDQKAKVTELRAQNKRGEKSDGSRQQKLAFGGANKTLQLDIKEDPNLQKRYDEARVLFSAKTFTAFNALKSDELYVKALLPKTYKKVKNKSVSTMSRHTDQMADDIRMELMSIIQSELAEKEHSTFGFDVLQPQPVLDHRPHPSLLGQEFEPMEVCVVRRIFWKRETAHRTEHPVCTRDNVQGGGAGRCQRPQVPADGQCNEGDHTVIWCVIHTLQLSIKVSTTR